MMFDLAEYVCPNGQPYPLVGVDGSSGYEVCQSQRHPNGYTYFVKNRCAETLWFDSLYLYRGLDTSAIDSDEVYAQFTNERYGAVWVKRFMNIGEETQRSPNVQHYHSNGSTQGKPHDSNVLTYMILKAHYDQFTAPHTGITVPDVVELHWTFDAEGQQVVEKYFYAHGRGLVAFSYVLGPGGYKSEIGALTSPPPPAYVPPAWFDEPISPPTVAPTPIPAPLPPVAPPNNIANPVKATLALDNVRLRSTPSTSGAIVRQMTQGESVTYFEQPLTYANNCDWVWVETKNGQGYAAKIINGQPVFSAN